MERSARVRLTLIAICLLVPALFGDARDFPEPLPVYDPLLTTEPDRGLGAYADLRFHHHSISASEIDLFDFGMTAAFAPLSVGPEGGGRFAFGVAAGTYLLVGPVAADEEAFSVAEWWMNAVQYEYGLYAGYRLAHLELLGPVDLLAEYSRTSQHPLRSGFSQVASDVLGIGAALPRVVRDWGAIETSIRGAYIDLYDFWQSPLPEPRTRWRLTAAARVERIIPALLRRRSGNEPRLFVDGELSALRLRGGGWDMVPRLRAGVLFPVNRSRYAVYARLYRSGDTEQLENERSPAFLAGFGVRMSLGR
jgi:hypothetical protein